MKNREHIKRRQKPGRIIAGGRHAIINLFI
jgi:hypothetical protein